MADIKKKIREIELSYDYNHSKEDYDVVVNLTEICTLFESVLAEERNNAIDEFAENIKDKYSDILFWLMKRQEEGYGTSNGELHDKWLCKIDEIAEKMKGGATDERTGSD